MEIVQVIIILACLFSLLSLTTASSKSSKASITISHLFLAPFSCRQSCVSGENFGGILAENNVKQCDAGDEDQVLRVHDTGTFVKLQMAANGYCFGLPHGGAEVCDGKLALVSCDDDPTAKWYFTGGQFFSAACWSWGHSAAMTVNEGCKKLTVTSTPNGADVSILMSQTFMFLEPKFVESIVPVTAPPTTPAPTPAPTMQPTTPAPTFAVTADIPKGGSAEFSCPSDSFCCVVGGNAVWGNSTASGDIRPGCKLLATGNGTLEDCYEEAGCKLQCDQDCDVTVL